MKKLIIVFLVVFLLTSVSCNRTANPIVTEKLLTKADSLLIVNKVLEVTEAFATANNTLNAMKIMEFWHYSDSSFFIVENTTIYPIGEELFKLTQDFYKAGIDTTHLSWGKREIIPLSLNFAHLYGEYDFYLKLKSGEVKNYHILYSALFKKINGNWKALRVHESYQTEGE